MAPVLVLCSLLVGLTLGHLDEQSDDSSAFQSANKDPASCEDTSEDHVYSRWDPVDVTGIPTVATDDILYAEDSDGERTVIGAGGAATLYLGSLKPNWKLCVLKSAHDHVSATDIQNEAKMMWHMTSSGVTPEFYGMLKNDEELQNAYVMEYLPKGNTLNIHLNNTLDMGPADIKSLVLGIAKAIQELHMRNVFHGDVRQDNIYVAPPVDPEVTKETSYYLLDLGQSARTNESYAYDLDEGFRDHLRTHYQYLAPELLEGGHFSTKSDIFALGHLLRELGLRFQQFSLVQVSHSFMARNPITRPDIQTAIRALERII